MSEKTQRQFKPMGDAPVYLLVVDNTDEFGVALHYAAKLALSNGAKLALLHVLEKEEFQHWGDIQDRMHEEYRAEAERELLEAAGVINSVAAMLPGLYLEESGNVSQMVLDIIDQDPSITKLILGGAAQSGGPGPLVSYFSGKGLNKLNVPLTIVPGNIESAVMDSLV